MCHLQMLYLQDVLNEKSPCYLRLPLPCTAWKAKLKYLTEYINSTFHFWKQWKSSQTNRETYKWSKDCKIHKPLLKVHKSPETLCLLIQMGDRKYVLKTK